MRTCTLAKAKVWAKVAENAKACVPQAKVEAGRRILEAKMETS
jgi:hypothetical protein